MRQLWLTSFAGVVLVVLFFEAGQASVVAVEPVNQPVNTTAGSFEVFSDNAVRNTVSVESKPMCCVDAIGRKDYAITPGVGVHKFFKQPSTWNVARDICIRDGAQLAVINSDAEEAFLRRWKTQNSVGSVWLGVHDLFEQGWWATLVGEPLSKMGYNAWAPNRPLYVSNTEHCGVLWNDQVKGMDNTHCDWKFSFFCEITMC